MGIDLSKLSLSELRKLRTAVDKAISSAEGRRRKEARAAVQKVAREYGVSIGELLAEDDTKPRRKKRTDVKRSAAKPKYRNPSDPTQTWTGKGRRPRWYLEALKAGKSGADLLA